MTFLNFFKFKQIIIKKRNQFFFFFLVSEAEEIELNFNSNLLAL
jgi:hypothetical protein